MATTRRGSAEVEVRFVDRFTREVRQAARTTEGDLKRSNDRNRQVMQRAAKDSSEDESKRRKKDRRGNWDPRHGAREMMDFGARVAEAAYDPIETYADFEKQMDSVAAATFDMTKAMDADKMQRMNAAAAELSATARRLGADTKYSAREAAAGMDILAKTFDGGGDEFQKAKDVAAAMPAILNLATASDKTIEQAADVATTAMSQFNMKADEMTRVSDVIVKTANTTNTGLLDLGEAFSKSGKLAKDAGIDIETYSAMLGVLGNKGLKGSIAGTGLGSIFGNIQSGMKKQKSALAAVGIDISDEKGNLRPFVKILEEMNKAADKKFGVGKGGVRRDRWLQGLMGGGIDKTVLAALMESAGTGELAKMVEVNREAAGTAKTMADAMSNNTAGAAAELSGAYEELKLTIGEELAPAFTDLLKGAKQAASGLASWAKENPELVKSLGLVAAAIAAIGVASGVAAAIMMVNPIVAIATGIALSAVLIYRHWEPISAFFAEHWGKVALLFAPVATLFAPIIGAAALIKANWEPISGFFVGLWNTVTGAFEGAMNWILGKIEWVGQKVEAFKVSIMSEEELAAYQQAQAEAARVASADAIEQEDLDRLASSTGRGGVGDYGSGLAASSAADNTASAMKAMRDWWSSGIVPGAATKVLEPNDAVKEAWAKLQNENLQPAPAKGEGVALGKPVILGADTGNKFKGELKVTFDPETGKVVNTQLRGDNPDFVVRANAGGQ